MKQIISALSLSYLMLPLVAAAQFTSGAGTGPLATFVDGFINFINDVLVPLVFAIAFLVFIWGVFQYFILGGSDEGKREQGKSLMLWAIIGFVLMVSIWGIVNLLSGTLGLGGDSLDDIPVVPGSS